MHVSTLYRRLRGIDPGPLVVFALALAVRLIYVLQIRDLPYFDVPLIDGPNYFRTAAVIASGSLTAGRLVFWQPPLYPYFLALLFVTVGTRMVAIYAVQAVLGSLSCVLAYGIGRRLFSRRAALWAGVVMALYGPLVHFDAQPLIPVLHIFLVLAGLLLLLRSMGIGEPAAGPPAGPSGRAVLGAGVLWGLAASATPNILFACPVAVLWAWRRTRRPAAGLLFLLGTILPIGLVAGRNLLAGGEAVLISSNGGINFYVGNNPDYDRTIRLRPGGEFERLAQEPANLGIVTASGRSRYFTSRALEFLRLYPGEAARLYLRKARDLIAGREIPRNQDQYAYRSASSLFATLLWRWGVSFPFGVVAPLALVGALLPRRFDPGAVGSPGDDAGRPAGRRLLLGYVASYALAILLFFPTDRYRLPLVPVLALFAARFLASLPSSLRLRRVVPVLLAGLVLFNLDWRVPAEAYPEEEALNRAYALRTKGRLEEARAAYREAMAINPRRLDPYNALATMAAEQGHWEEAARLYTDLLEHDAAFPEIRRSLGEAYAALGRKEEARREWDIAIRLAPGDGLALADLCMSYYEEGILTAAEPYCARGVQARPDLPETHLAMGLVARALRQRDRARAELTEAARLFPADSAGRRRADEILEKMRRRDQRLRDDMAPDGP